MASGRKIVHMKLVNVMYSARYGSTLKNADRFSYYTYSMDAPSRNEFLKMYGKNAELWPRDIVSISYGKKTLYHKDISESDSMAS